MPEQKKEEQKIENRKTEQCCCSCGGSKKKFAIATIVVILIAILGIYASLWKKEKDEKISLGLSSQDFPYRDYTEEELNKMYPQIKNADVPTRVTPEETYRKLKEALKTENIDAAVDCFVEEKREERGEDLEKIKKQNFMQEMEQDLTELTLEQMGDAFAIYSYSTTKDGKTYAHFINFIKDSNGDWKIKSL